MRRKVEELLSKEEKVFCVLPWIHLCGSVDGVWGRCCVDRTMYYDDYYKQAEKPKFNLHSETIGCSPFSVYAKDNPEKKRGILQAFNSPELKRTRKQMLAGDAVYSCEYCYEREGNGGNSYRQIANKTFIDKDRLKTLIEKTRSDGSLDAFPFYLDIRFGNTCNFACVMCNFPISSKWGNNDKPQWTKIHINPYENDAVLWENLRENITKIERVYFAGGEPFLQKQHFQLLDLLIESGQASSVDLAYNTNLSVLPQGIFEKLKKFKSVDIGASCDGIKEVYESIRCGGRWNVFVKNVRETKKHFQIRLSVTPQKQNIFHLEPLIEWAINESCLIDLKNILIYPDELSIKNLPKNEKALLIEKYKQLVIRYEARNYKDISEDLELIVKFLS